MLWICRGGRKAVGRPVWKGGDLCLITITGLALAPFAGNMAGFIMRRKRARPMIFAHLAALPLGNQWGDASVAGMRAVI